MRGLPEYKGDALRYAHQHISYLLKSLGREVDGLRVETTHGKDYYRVLLGGRELFIYNLKNGVTRLPDGAVFRPYSGFITERGKGRRFVTFQEVLQEALDGKHAAPDWIKTSLRG